MMISLNEQIENYRQLLFEVAPPIVLVDMDGVLVDWDSGTYSRQASSLTVLMLSH
jgi:hypothetical protein